MRKTPEFPTFLHVYFYFDIKKNSDIDFCAFKNSTYLCEKYFLVKYRATKYCLFYPLNN